MRISPSGELMTKLQKNRFVELFIPITLLHFLTVNSGSVK
jgi:hypothetical protein